MRASKADAGKRLDAFLHERLPEYSRARLQGWIKSGRVLLAGAGARPSLLLRGDETVSITPAELAPLKAVAEELPLTILYEDDDVVAVDKAAGMVVHAGAGHSQGTLVNALLHHFGSLSTVNGDLRPGIVHRLDKDTSGVLVVARTDRAHQDLARQFHDREIEKRYVALVHGTMQHKQAVLATKIGRDPVRRTRMRTNVATGRSALTEYRVLEELGHFSYLGVRIGTGRTHQIRVQLANIGHPIAGDRLYGAPPDSHSRFFLHADLLRFRSPSTRELITVESPLPPELTAWLQALRKDG
ncbi:MAG TPA: RluA family pseudouridine synthase [Bryobacteraceae bacterium]|nr:RluA family pseudouridine synthase [Bryobacteraceae bacterium]